MQHRARQDLPHEARQDRTRSELHETLRAEPFGPGTVLTGLVRKILPGAALQNVSGVAGLADA